MRRCACTFRHCQCDVAVDAPQLPDYCLAICAGCEMGLHVSLPPLSVAIEDEHAWGVLRRGARS